MPRFLPRASAAAFGVLAVLVALAVASVAGVRGQTLRQPPTAAERAYAARIGWPAAAEEIGAALRAAYHPGHGAAAGSVGNRAFQSWLLLYRWSELLARPESDELARFLARFFRLDPKSPRPPGITFVPPGELLPPELPPISPAELAALGREAGARAELLSRLLPATFEPAPGASTGKATPPGKAIVADRLRPEFFAAMAGDEAFLRAFFGVLSADDFAPAALEILQEIHAADPEKWKSYRNLAIAIALVRDQRPPAWWPHNQVRPEAVPLGSARPVDEFRFWVASNEGQRLYNDLRLLAPEELKFIVDAPVAAKELEWAQRHVRFPRGDFGRAFSAIRYQLGRVAAQVYVWNGGPYTLDAIRSAGGICVDQAYFAMLAGKAKGLPTLYFTGQGADGGHAWFGYLKGEGRWDMDCGRYENQNYAVGEALDPQTWQPINDHELASLAQSFRRTPAYLASRDDLVMARLFEAAGDPARALTALTSALTISPRNDLAWAAKSAYLERAGASAASRRAFHEEAIKQFPNNQDLKVRHQRALATLARGSGDETAARAFEAQIISQNRRSRADLSVNAAAARLTALVDAKKYDDAMREYRGLIARLGRTSGGNLFYEIVRPFALSLARSGDLADARRAVDLARSALRPEYGSILDQDLRALAEGLARLPASAP